MCAAGGGTVRRTLSIYRLILQPNTSITQCVDYIFAEKDLAAVPAVLLFFREEPEEGE